MWAPSWRGDVIGLSFSHDGVYCIGGTTLVMRRKFCFFLIVYGFLRCCHIDILSGFSISLPRCHVLGYLGNLCRRSPDETMLCKMPEGFVEGRCYLCFCGRIRYCRDNSNTTEWFGLTWWTPRLCKSYGIWLRLNAWKSRNLFFF